MIGTIMQAVPVERGEDVALVFDPATGKRLPPGGVRVAVSAFWMRQERAGDVELKPLEAVALAPVEAVSEPAAEPEEKTDSPRRKARKDVSA